MVKFTYNKTQFYFSCHVWCVLLRKHVLTSYATVKKKVNKDGLGKVFRINVHSTRKWYWKCFCKCYTRMLALEYISIYSRKKKQFGFLLTLRIKVSKSPPGQYSRTRQRVRPFVHAPRSPTIWEWKPKFCIIVISLIRCSRSSLVEDTINYGVQREKRKSITSWHAD